MLTLAVDQAHGTDRAQPARVEARRFGALLREYRLAAGLTQDALAEQAGLSVRGTADLERGARRFPHAATVERLSDALGLSTAERAAFELESRRPGTRADVWPVVSHVATREPDLVRLATDVRHNLPPQLTSFVGRNHELAEVRRLLDECRVVTLTGAGGIGKTRLAVEASRLAEAAGAYSASVWLVELASLAQPELVAGTVARTVGIREEPGRPVLDTLTSAGGSPAPWASGGDAPGAARHLREAFRTARAIGFRRNVAENLLDFGMLARVAGQPERGARLIGAAQAPRSALNVQIAVRQRQSYEETRSAPRAALGDTHFSQAWAEGHAMTLDEAVAYTLVEDEAGPLAQT